MKWYKKIDNTIYIGPDNPQAEGINYEFEFEIIGDCIYADITEIEKLMNLSNYELHKNYHLIPPLNPKFKFNPIKR
jgi:hypothetical protein